MSKFFTFDQNNSGGSFVVDEQDGIGCNVVIEADNSDHANAIAENIGLYFDGCVEDRDCPCCGDRWYRAYGDGDDVPSQYGEPFERGLPDTWRTGGYIHYLDGRIEKI